MTIGEAINSVIKKANGKGIISVKETIKLLHQEVKSQEEKLNMSWIGRGEWRLANEVKGVLQITEQKYSSMNSKMKIRYIQQLGICMFFFFVRWKEKCPTSLFRSTQVRYCHYPSCKNLIKG